MRVHLVPKPSVNETTLHEQFWIYSATHGFYSLQTRIVCCSDESEVETVSGHQYFGMHRRWKIIKVESSP